MTYRLSEDSGGLPEGACISQEQFKNVYYTDKPLFDLLEDFEEKDMIEYKDEDLCKSLGIKKILFYSDMELQKFIDKNVENGITG
jgi:hypothetical protein